MSIHLVEQLSPEVSLERFLIERRIESILTGGSHLRSFELLEGSARIPLFPGQLCPEPVCKVLYQACNMRRAFHATSFKSPLLVKDLRRYL